MHHCLTGNYTATNAYVGTHDRVVPITKHEPGLAHERVACPTLCGAQVELVADVSPWYDEQVVPGYGVDIANHERSSLLASTIELRRTYY